jgi:rhodanese-related sulfurtransferase
MGPAPKFVEFLEMKSAHDLVVAAKGRIREIPAEQAEQAIRNADLLIDVREGDEYAAGHIPGAVHMSRGMLEFKLSSNPDLAARDLNLVLYCKTSGRAALACVALQEMGYHNVQSIAGGYDGWIAAGKPVAKPPVTKFE